jgi:F0F1-type ATP synthase alpha subunit
MYSTLYAANSGAFDEVPLDKIKAAESALHRELKNKHAKLTEALNTGDKPTDEQNAQILKVAKAITETYKEVKKGSKE